MEIDDYGKIISTVAKKNFEKYNIKQKGKSRIWIDDNGYFIIIIEFQPFSGRKGTTLNIGANFNWYKQNYFSFDIGGRKNIEFIYFENKESFDFDNQVEKLCQIAIEDILKYRKKLKNIFEAKNFILDYDFNSQIWGFYHKAIISFLTNDFENGNYYFNKILQIDQNFDRIEKLKVNILFLLKQINSGEKIDEIIIGIIKETRILKQLPEIEIKF